MALTSADVNNQSFSIDRKGYDVDEVDVFLERVAAELDDLNNQIIRLNDKLKAAKRQGSASAPQAQASSEGGASQRELDKRDVRIRELEAQVKDRRADDSAIAQALIIAQRSADEIVTTANDNADNIKQDAEDEAQRILDKANAEKQRVLDEIKKLEEDREISRSKYSDMLGEFISNSNDLLNDLESKKPGAKKGNRGSHGLNMAPTPRTAVESSYTPSTATATYTTPSVNPVVVAPATPKPSKGEKDFSGFGDTEDGFEFDDVD